jgi:hypothetical protein
MKKSEEKISDGYTILPHRILNDHRLTATDVWIWISIYSFMRWRDGLCCPSLSKIMQRSRKSNKTVYKSREKLQILGYLDWHSKIGRACHYTFSGDCFPDDIREKLETFGVELL